MEKWVEELRVGSQFVTEHRYDGTTLHTVAKITDKQIVTDRGCRFWKKNSKSTGGGVWDRDWMQQLTEEKRNQLFRQRMKKMIKDVDVNKLSLGQLERIREAILDR